jgi:hypothetical protein
MKTRNLALIAVLAAGSWSGAIHAQPGYPPPPPPPNPGYGAPPPPDQPYDNQGPQGPDNQPGYDNQGPDQGNDDQNPYYNDQGPDNSYDPNTDPGYDPTAGYNPDGQVDESVFYANLHPYGRWIERPSYGWVWEPTQVSVGWRPYTVGRWVDSDYGWTWVSDEPWGWATYHYGRWASDPEFGWLWVPGREWGPAWCSFQQGNGYIGWAPLPPAAGFQVGVGIRLGGLRIDALAYSFVPERAFLETRVDRVILPPARNVTFIRNTRDITNIRVVNNRIMNNSVPVEHIEQVTGQRVQRFRVADVRTPGQAPRTAQVQGDQIRIFRPAANLVQARPNVTPQAVINRRAQVQPGQPGRPGQPIAGQPGRPQGVGVPPRLQPGEPQPVPGRTGQPQPRWQRQQAASQAELDSKHQGEQQRLQAQQADERNRLQQLHQQELQDQRVQSNQARAQEVQAQHQVEMKAQQDREQQQMQQLRARQQRERPAQQARPRQDRPNQGQQNQRNREPERKPPAGL